MWRFILAGLLVVSTTASNSEELKAKFRQFKLEYGKTYNTQDEEMKRFNIFQNNLRSFEEHNALYERSIVTYKQGVTKFADMTQQELKDLFALNASKKPYFDATKHVRTGFAIPDSFDWRTEGQVTEVKDLGLCVAPWAFSVTGSTEAAYYRKNGTLVSLSEQQLIDCTTDINDGCAGGLLDETFPYVQQYGLQSEDTYPYVATNDTCKYNENSVVTKISEFISIPSKDEDALLDAVANIGPVSVRLDGRYIAWYVTGIFESDWCTTDYLNHGVLIVGYGTESDINYWIVKNSWGPSWGEKGYIRIVRGQNECGIAEDAGYPTI